MKYIAGIDIGNATTETAIGVSDGDSMKFVSTGISKTTGIKGTLDNMNGVYASLRQALKAADLEIEDLSSIQINEAAPVIGDVAMETITETVITESTMIGHNPHTPGGVGIGYGYTVDLRDAMTFDKTPLIVLVNHETDFIEASRGIEDLFQAGKDVRGAILAKDDGVLVQNRIDKLIPIVDEVCLFDKIPRNMYAAIEVAPVGGVVETLSNPYGIATLFELTPEETKFVVPISRALIGNRSAVVIKTPEGDVKARKIPAGIIRIEGEKRTKEVDVDHGAETLMKVLEVCAPVRDIRGEAGTNAGAMLERVRQVMAKLTGMNHEDVSIQDLLAVDTISPQSVQGGLAGEYSMESAVGVAAMVKADRLQMQRIANALHEKLKVPVEVGGVEAEMAIYGALTTPGTSKPLAIIDMGAGSTDASIMKRTGEIELVHLAGAGNMVTLLIDTELGIGDLSLSEDIKKHPLAKVESMHHIRHEDGTVEFFKTPVDSECFARVVILKPEGMIPIRKEISIEKVKLVRKLAKEKVFVTNALRSLKQVSPTGNIRDIDYVVLVGGSALDFEVPQLVTEALSQYGIVAGRGNIRGSEGPRNAVATGLVLSAGR